jgi:hypothetical protein
MSILDISKKHCAPSDTRYKNKTNKYFVVVKVSASFFSPKIFFIYV